MKYFVTGGAGFIGSNYVRWLLANSDHQITVYDKLTYAGNLENLRDVLDDDRCTFVQGDICDRDTVEERVVGRAKRLGHWVDREVVADPVDEPIAVLIFHTEDISSDLDQITL